MKFISTATALLASAALVVASPMGGSTAERAVEPEGKKNARDGYMSGVCNGTSCKFGFSNFDCDVGSCTEQSGGGDGKSCYDNDGTTYCPGGR